MREHPLPPEFSWLSGRVRFVHRATATELASSCPNCGGDLHRNGEWPDRFRIFTVGKLRAWCRKCGTVLFPDSNEPGFRPDPEQIRRWNEEREQQYLRQKHIAEQALDVLEHERKWIEWHEHMEEKHREMWEQAGIPRSWQDFWKLGYTPSRRFEYGGETYDRPALVIPKFDFGWQVKNIDFRLMDPPPGVGKYRPVANLPPFAYNSTPQLDTFQDEVFVVEGSKKAMVLSIHTGPDQRQVIGLPSCNSWAGMDEKLKECGRVWVIFDPDATAWAYKFANSVGKTRARIVELSYKPDDAIIKYGMTPALFQMALRQAVRI